MGRRCYRMVALLLLLLEVEMLHPVLLVQELVRPARWRRIRVLRGGMGFVLGSLQVSLLWLRYCCREYGVEMGVEGLLQYAMEVS